MEGGGRACYWGADMLADDAEAPACTSGFVMANRPFKSKFWDPLSTNLVIDNDCVHLSVTRCTMVPTLAEGTGHGAPRARGATVPLASPASLSPPTSPVLDPLFPELPTPITTALGPSVLMKLSGTTPQCEVVPALCTDSDSPVPEDEAAKDKEQRRMRRNRESAAVSRERKRKYIADLEHRVGQLELQVFMLHKEKRLWQSLQVPPLDNRDSFDAVCECHSSQSPL